jgi:tetratricopeptide (TPR) repeat protein
MDEHNHLLKLIIKMQRTGVISLKFLGLTVGLLVIFGLASFAYGFPEVGKRPRLIVLPFQPEKGEAYDGTGLAVQFLLGNVVALHTGLTEFWFGWRINKLFPEKGTLSAYCRGSTLQLDINGLGKQQGIRYWLRGSVKREGSIIKVAPVLTDTQDKGPERTAEFILDPGHELIRFRKGILNWLETCGLPMPEAQIAKVLWPEKTTLRGLGLLGQALEVYYLHSTGEILGPLDMAHFDQAVAAAPASYLALDLKAWALYKREDTVAAAEAFHSAINLNANGLGALSGLMWCAIRTEDEKEAYLWAAAKAKSRSESPVLGKASAASRMGNIAYRSSDYGRAVYFYDKAANWNTANVVYVTKLADAYHKDGQSHQAFEVINKALGKFQTEDDRQALLTKKSDFLSHVAESLTKEGKNQEAIGYFHQAIAIDMAYRPKKAAGNHQKLGFIYEALGDYTNALNSYLEADRISPNQAGNKYRAAFCYQKLGNHWQAVHFYEEVLKLDPRGDYGKMARAQLEKISR